MGLVNAEMAGDQLQPAEIENHTLLVIPTQYHEHIQTVHTKPGEQSPAIQCQVVDLTTQGGPTTYNGVLWFNKMLFGGLKRQLGQTILGRMVKGQATPGTGKNPPWQLSALIGVAGEEAWVTFAEGWLNSAEGQEWEANGIRLSQQAPAGQPAQPPAPGIQQAPATPAPPVVAAPPAAPAGPPVTAPPAAPVAAPPAPPAPAGAAPAVDLASALAAMGPEEQQAMLAILANQGKAAS